MFFGYNDKNIYSFAIQTSIYFCCFFLAAPSSSDSDEEGLFSSGVGRRRPPPLPGGSKHPSSSASSPAASLVPASDDASTGLWTRCSQVLDTGNNLLQCRVSSALSSSARLHPSLVYRCSMKWFRREFKGFTRLLFSIFLCLCQFPSSVLSNDSIEIVFLYNPGPNGKALRNECGSCLLAVVPSTNVENVRAFPDVNPIANRAGRGALQPSSQALLKPHVPGARGLFSSDTEEDDLFGTNPPPLNSWVMDL